MLFASIADLKKLYEIGQLDEMCIRRFAESWRHQVQWTAPRPSSRNVEDLLQEVAPLFLTNLNSGSELVALADDLKLKVRRPGKRRAVKLAIDSLMNELTERFREPKSRVKGVLKRDFATNGHFEAHELDLAVVNGALKAGAFALSFGQTNKVQLKRDMDATAFAIEDIRRSHRQMSLSVLAYAEGADPADVARAESLFQNWAAPVVTERGISSWSRSLVSELPDAMFHD